MSEFSTRFKKIRHEIGKTQDEFALILNSSRTRITGWEKNEPDFVSILNRLQTDCNVNLNWLISGTGNIFNSEHKEIEKEDILTRVENIEKILYNAGFIKTK